jgi:glycosyltransferase involved in cell wall biosynthesis
MKLVLLLEGTEPWGGVKVVLELANLLQGAGHHVGIVSKGRNPDWFPLLTPFQQVAAFGVEAIPVADYIIGTYWTTIPPAVDAGRGVPVHFCQGYEGDYYPEGEPYGELRRQIEAAYRLPTLKVTIRPHLKRLIEARFGQPAHDIGDGIDLRRFIPGGTRPSPHPPRVLVVGPWDWPFKGVPTALEGLRQLRGRRDAMWVVRASQLPQSEAERALGVVDEYHDTIMPYAMPALYQGCDVFVSTSTEAEGFGLPALEAMACGLPCVLSQIPSYLSFATERSYALFVPPRDPAAVADAVDRLLRDPDLGACLRKAGLEVASQYPIEAVARRLEQVLLTQLHGGPCHEQ